MDPNSSIVATDEAYCRRLNDIPHTSPENFLFGFAIPWVVVLVFAIGTMQMASDNTYKAMDGIETKSDPDIGAIEDNTVPSASIPDDTTTSPPDASTANDTPILEMYHPAPRSKALALACATVLLVPALLAFTNQILALCDLSYCMPPSAGDHFWLNLTLHDPWGPTEFWLGIPLFCAIIAWLKTLTNVICARWGIYYDDSRWHHYSGFYGLYYFFAALGVTPFVIVGLAVYAVAMVVVGRAGQVREGAGRGLEWVDLYVRDPGAAGLRLRRKWERRGEGNGNEERGSEEGDEREESPLLRERGSEGEEVAPAYEEPNGTPPPYTDVTK